MMQKFTMLFVALLAGVFFSKAQNLPIHEASGKVAFIENVSAAGMTAGDLMKVMKEWGDAQEGFELEKEDMAGGELVYKAKFTVFYGSPVGGSAQNGDVNYKFSLFAKEGKYRYVANEFVHSGNGKAPDGGPLEEESPACGKGKMLASSWGKVKNKTKNTLDELAVDLKKNVKAAQNDPTKEDW